MADDPKQITQYDYSLGNELTHLVAKLRPEIAATRITRTPIHAVPTSQFPLTGLSADPNQYAYYMPGRDPSSKGFIALNTDSVPQSPTNPDELALNNKIISHEQWHAFQAQNPATIKRVHDKLMVSPDYRQLQDIITSGNTHYSPREAAIELPAFIASDSLPQGGFLKLLADSIVRKTGKGSGAYGNIYPLELIKGAPAEARSMIDRIRQTLIDSLTPDELKLIKQR